METKITSEKENDDSLIKQDKIEFSPEAVKKLVSDTTRDLFDEAFAKDKSGLLTTFGVFASIITFLSVQVQILQNAITFNELVFLSLLTGLILLGFITILQWVTKIWIEKSDGLAVSFLAFIFVIITVLIGFFGYRSINEKNENAVIETGANNLNHENSIK